MSDEKQDVSDSVIKRAKFFVCGDVNSHLNDKLDLEGKKDKANKVEYHEENKSELVIQFQGKYKLFKQFQYTHPNNFINVRTQDVQKGKGDLCTLPYDEQGKYLLY